MRPRRARMSEFTRITSCCASTRELLQCGCYYTASLCCSADFEDDWSQPCISCCLAFKPEYKNTAPPAPIEVMAVPPPPPSPPLPSPTVRLDQSPSDQDIDGVIHASLDVLFPEMKGEHDRQLRVLQAQSLCTTLPSFAGAAIVMSAAGSGKNSSGPEVEPDIVVPTIRDEIIYDLVGTTFGVCKLCFCDKKSIRMEPCGHMCCAHCKDLWDSKVILHGPKLDLPAPALEAKSVCPFCKTGVTHTVAVKVEGRPGSMVASSAEHHEQPGAEAALTREESMPLLESCISPQNPTTTQAVAVFESPSSWAPVPEEEYALGIAKVFPLSLREQEAETLIAAFLGSLVDDTSIDVAKVNVVAVKRIQNMALYQSYSCARKIMLSQHQHCAKPEELERHVEPSPAAVWEVKVEVGWIKYSSPFAAEIERAYQMFKVQGGAACCLVTDGRCRDAYRISFDSGANHTQTQTYDRFGTVRAVRRWAPYACSPDTDKVNTEKPENGDLISTDIERTLYHGTTAESTIKIIQQGFNRSFAGRHGTRYGRGVYFALNAGYAAQPVYAQPDEWGIKRVLVCKVLTGNTYLGRPRQKVPDVLDKTTGRLYDSAVDNVADPSIFVTFNDAHAYPDYCIEFEVSN